MDLCDHKNTLIDFHNRSLSHWSWFHVLWYQWLSSMTQTIWNMTQDPLYIWQLDYRVEYAVKIQEGLYDTLEKVVRFSKCGWNSCSYMLMTWKPHLVTKWKYLVQSMGFLLIHGNIMDNLTAHQSIGFKDNRIYIFHSKRGRSKVKLCIKITHPI